MRENQFGEVHVTAIFQVGERGLKPDVAFVSTPRLDGDENKGFTIPPDLAIEVVSPTDVQWRVADKAFAYLSAGTRLVWVLDPRSQTVTIYRSESDITLLTREDTLTGEDVVQGFTCPVSQLLNSYDTPAHEEDDDVLGIAKENARDHRESRRRSRAEGSSRNATGRFRALQTVL